MQSSSLSQSRASQRRQGSTFEDSSFASIMDSQPAASTRSASGTSSMSRGHGSRSSNPDKQISQIEKSVTHLLVATKQLLETLTQWSRSQAQEEEVSDVYVRLGYEFNLACRAFNSIGVDTTDLGPVPDLLRTILEDTLSQPASPQALDTYLPRIRDIIINLLQGLKKKQSKLRTRPGTASSSSKAGQPPSRQGSMISAATDITGTTLVDDALNQSTTRSDSKTRRDSPSGLDTFSTTTDNTLPVSSGIERSSLRRSIRRESQQQIPSSDSSSTMSSTTAQNLPIISPPLADSNSTVANFPHAPPPPPKQDALTALSRGGDLERRASRRFSAYQISKHLGASPNGVPVIPPAQNSPIPNRGREARESMRAVTSRSAYQTARQKSKLGDGSPSRSGTIKSIESISEEIEDTPVFDSKNVPKIQIPQDQIRSDSPTAKTPDEFRSTKVDETTSAGLEMTATVNGPFSPTKEANLSFSGIESQKEQEVESGSSTRDVPAESPSKTSHIQPPPSVRPSVTPPPASTLDLDSSPASVKELTLFLQYKTRVKKFVLPGGYEDLTLARLQLAFIEKFAWNTHNDGVDLPEIYIQDPISGVRHELEELSDVKDRSVLVLNVEVLDEVKKHFDEGLGGLKTTLDGVKSLLDGQSTMMQRFSDRQLEASKEMARLSAAPTPRATRAPTLDFDKDGPPTSRATEEQVQEIQNLRRDIAVLRQTYASMSSDFEASMKDIKAKAANVKTAAVSAAAPVYEGSAGRTHVNEGKKTLMTDSEALVNRVDNLTDTVEELRKDVVSRGVRPRPRDLEVLSKEISSISKDLTRLQQFMKREKPVWTKIWEQELSLVMTERDDLSQQEELMQDLFGDLEDVQNVFNLVEEAMKQQNVQGGTGLVRQTSKTVEIDPTINPSQAKEGVLDEVRALRPNHEDRLEAIERAEKMRLKDLESRKANEFQREVEQFVEEGKLKKTGGMDEVERLRKLKDERAMKENWATQQAQEAEKLRKRAEREAAKAAAKKAAQEESKSQEQPQENGEVVDEVAEEKPAENTTVATEGASNDTSLEGESAFLDAPSEAVPTNTSAVDDEKSTPSQPVSSVEEGDKVESTAPQLPEIDVGNKKADDKNDDKADGGNRSSWWKPAVF